MQRSTDRILSTHVGSLPRPADLQQTLQIKDRGEPYDEAAFEIRVREAVGEAFANRWRSGSTLSPMRSSAT
jgi:5-methyltetrahydropteroyltriglutamate--homocysteine methyltransferase